MLCMLCMFVYVCVCHKYIFFLLFKYINDSYITNNIKMDNNKMDNNKMDNNKMDNNKMDNNKMDNKNEDKQLLKEKIIIFIGNKYGKSTEEATQAYSHFEKQLFEDMAIIEKQTGLSLLETYELYEKNNYHLEQSMLSYHDPSFVKTTEQKLKEQYEALTDTQKKIKGFNYIMACKDYSYEMAKDKAEENKEQEKS